MTARRRFARALGLLSLSLLGACSRSAAPPLVVLVTIDTLRADHLGAYGYARARTPNLDALAERGALFERASTTSNNTLPAHAAILTGRYPQSIGVPRNSFPLPRSETTLAELFHAAGFATAAFVSASALSASLGLGEGFDVYDEDFPVEEVDQWQRRAAGTTDAALRWLEQQVAGEQVVSRPEAGRPAFVWIH